MRHFDAITLGNFSCLDIFWGRPRQMEENSIIYSLLYSIFGGKFKITLQKLPA